MDNKKEMKVTMLLYKRHDYDLVDYAWSLKDKSLKNPRVNIHGVMIALLNQYLHGTQYIVRPLKEHTKKDLPSKVYVRFTFNREKDADMCQMLSSIRKNQRNSFLKSLLRRNMPMEGLDCYFEDVQSVPNSKPQKKKTIKKSLKPKQNKNKSLITEPAKPITESYTTEISSAPIPDDSEVNSFDFFGALGDINN